MLVEILNMTLYDVFLPGKIAAPIENRNVGKTIVNADEMDATRTS